MVRGGWVDDGLQDGRWVDGGLDGGWDGGWTVGGRDGRWVDGMDAECARRAESISLRSH